MTAPGTLLRVGLTGGIASGKSTVGRFLSDLGAFVLDADGIAHELISPGGSAHEKVVGRFGREILDAGGEIDRPALARRVFTDPEARQALNAIVHPLVKKVVDRRMEEYRVEGRGSPVAVLDAALLVETGSHRDFHRLIVVRCERSTQIERLVERDGLTGEEAAARIDAQASLEEKVKVADYVIDTQTSLEETRRQTRQVYASLLGHSQETPC